MRALPLLVVLLATAASSADLATASSRAREASSQKPQWAPSGNFSALHGSTVFPSETRSGAGAYARERRETAAAKRIWSYANLGPSRFVDPDGRATNLVTGAIGAGIGFAVGFGAALLDGDSLTDAALTGGKTAVVGGLAGLTFGASLAAGAGVGTVASLTAGKMALGAAASIGHQQLEVQAGLRARVSAKDVVFGAGIAGAVPTGAAFSQLPQAAKSAIGVASVSLGALAAGTGAGQLTDALEIATSSSPAAQSRAPWMAALGTANTLFGLLGIGGGATILPKPSCVTPAPVVVSAAASYDEAAALAAWESEGGSLTGGPQVPREPVLYGPFYRFPRPNEPQVVIDTGMQGGVASRAGWGDHASPSVKAWTKVPDSMDSSKAYSFYTTVKPSNESAAWATWNEGAPGVLPGRIGEADACFIPVCRVKAGK